VQGLIKGLSYLHPRTQSFFIKLLVLIITKLLVSTLAKLLVSALAKLLVLSFAGGDVDCLIRKVLGKCRL
jgi:hypothetical protein